MGWAVRGLDCGKGIGFALISHSAGWGAFENSGCGCQRFLPGCLRGSSTQLQGVGLGAGGFCRPAHGSDWSKASTAMAMTHALKALAMLPGFLTAPGRDQVLAQVSLFRSRRARVSCPRGKREGHGRHSAEFCDPAMAGSGGNKARSRPLQEPSRQWAPV